MTLPERSRRIKTSRKDSPQEPAGLDTAIKPAPEPFAAVPHKLLADPRLTATDKVIAGTLLFWSHDKAECWMGNDAVANRVGVHTNTVPRSLARLQECGWVKVFNDESVDSRRRIILAWHLDAESVISGRRLTRTLKGGPVNRGVNRVLTAGLTKEEALQEELLQEHSEEIRDVEENQDTQAVSRDDPAERRGVEGVRPRSLEGEEDADQDATTEGEPSGPWDAPPEGVSPESWYAIKSDDGDDVRRGGERSTKARKRSKPARTTDALRSKASVFGAVRKGIESRADDGLSPAENRVETMRFAARTCDAHGLAGNDRANYLAWTDDALAVELDGAPLPTNWESPCQDILPFPNRAAV